MLRGRVGASGEGLLDFENAGEEVRLSILHDFFSKAGVDFQAVLFGLVARKLVDEVSELCIILIVSAFIVVGQTFGDFVQERSHHGNVRVAYLFI